MKGGSFYPPRSPLWSNTYRTTSLSYTPGYRPQPTKAPFWPFCLAKFAVHTKHSRAAVVTHRTGLYTVANAARVLEGCVDVLLDRG